MVGCPEGCIATYSTQGGEVEASADAWVALFADATFAMHAGAGLAVLGGQVGKRSELTSKLKTSGDYFMKCAFREILQRSCQAVLLVCAVQLLASPQASAEDYLSPDFRKQVERLKTDALADPTTALNVVDRAPIVWEWMNAQAMQGERFLIDLPLWLSYPVSQPEETVIPMAIRAIDGAIHELRIKDDVEGAVGPVTTTTPGPFEVNSHQTIIQIDKGAFVCAEDSIEVGAFRNKAMAALFSGEGMFQTKVEGAGALVIQADGPIEIVELKDDRLTVDGSFAVAREASLDFSMKKAAKSLLASAGSGEGIVSVIEGTGTVYLAPIPNVYACLFASLR